MAQLGSKTMHQKNGTILLLPLLLLYQIHFIWADLAHPTMMFNCHLCDLAADLAILIYSASRVFSANQRTSAFTE